MVYNTGVEKERFIVHVDMDAFFAAVEQRDQPDYRGKPVVVGADPKEGQGRGVVAACSYEARQYGIHSAMPISFAYKRCPHAVYLRGNMKKYADISRQIFQILERFTPDIEPISIDEAFMDITGSYKLIGTPEDTCKKIKAAIQADTGLIASIGMAPNKMTAKIASDLEKPDGLVIVTREGLFDFLHPLPVSKLWGVGKKTREELTRLGINTIGDLAARELEDLSKLLGKSGIHVWKLANGIDPRDVETSVGIKSIGHEHTFDEDVTDPRTIEDTLMWLAEKVSRRLRKKGLRGRTISLKIRLSDFSTYTRAKSLNIPTNYVDDLFKITLEKAKDFKLGKQPIRLIGIQVSNLEQETEQLGLFGAITPGSEKKEKLYEAVDQIKDKFGEKAIKHRK